VYEFIVNLHSASGYSNHIWEQVKDYLDKNKVEYFYNLTEYPGHAIKLAGESNPDNMLVVVGGDGTFNEVINGLKNHSSHKVGYIPTGSGNDLARGINITHDHMDNIKRILADNETVSYDLGKITFDDGTSRYYAISCGMGLDAEVCYYTNISKLKKILNYIHLGNLTYILLTIHRLFSMKTADVVIKQKSTDDTIRYSKLIFLAGMNQISEGGGVKMAPTASPRDGKLNFISAHDVSKARCFMLLPKLQAGKCSNVKGFGEIIDDSIEVELSRPMHVHTDGEDVGLYSKCTIECAKGYLNLLN